MSTVQTLKAMFHELRYMLLRPFYTFQAIQK